LPAVNPTNWLLSQEITLPPDFVHIICLVMIEEEIRKYLDKGGFLSDAIDEFEHRPQQIAMAEAVGRVFDSEHH